MVTVRPRAYRRSAGTILAGAMKISEHLGGHRSLSNRPVSPSANMRDDYLREAQKIIEDPYILVNVISTRVKGLRRGARPLVESLEKLELEDIALREVIEGRITYSLDRT